MIMDVEGRELSPGDQVLITKKIKRIVDVGQKREVYLEDGTAFTIMEDSTIEISTHTIKLGD